jgi:hypothetical protein
MEFAAAVATAQKPRQQQFAFTGCSASERAAHAGCIVGDCFEIAFELVPADVGGVMILDQNVPCFGWKRWSTRWLYESLRLFNGYKVRWSMPKVAPAR